MRGYVPPEKVIPEHQPLIKWSNKKERKNPFARSISTDADDEATPQEEPAWTPDDLALMEARKITREQLSTWDEIRDEQHRLKHPEPWDPREGRNVPFKHKFHPGKGMSIADLESLRKTQAAAAEKSRESLFGDGPLPPPTPRAPDLHRAERVDLLKPLSHIPPPSRFQKLRDERDERIRKKVTGWRAVAVPLELVQDPNQFPLPKPKRPKLSNEEFAKKLQTPVNPLRFVRELPDGTEQEVRLATAPPGYTGDWVVHWSKPALSRLKIYQITAEKSQFHHEPSHEELAQRVGCKLESLEEEMQKGEAYVELRRLRPLSSPPKPSPKRRC
jgi:hypothetical protein